MDGQAAWKRKPGGGSWNGRKGDQLELEERRSEMEERRREMEERRREMEECVQKEGCMELKFQKWNNPEIQDMVMEVD